MAWRKTAAVVTLAMVPTFAAISGAMADQQQHHHGDASDEQPLGVAVSASSSDAAWIASQLHQPRFAARRDQPVMSLPRDSRADANAMPDGPHVNGLRSDGEPTRVVAVAERYRGTNPTGHSRAWCALFANMVLARAGYGGTGSAAARSFARYGRAASGPAPGVIAVWPHHGGIRKRIEPSRTALMRARRGMPTLATGSAVLSISMRRSGACGGLEFRRFKPVDPSQPRPRASCHR